MPRFALPTRFQGRTSGDPFGDQLQKLQSCYYQAGQVQIQGLSLVPFPSNLVWFNIQSVSNDRTQGRLQKTEKTDRQALPLTSTISAAGLPTSPRRGMWLAAEPRGPHLGCFCVSGMVLFFGLCSSGKSNLLNSNSGLEVDVVFSRTLDFRSVWLWQPSVIRGWKAGIKVRIQLAH